jgi:undecaprenyl-phosphate 4-deoxy-4-formamido-L-arabinose transferase
LAEQHGFLRNLASRFTKLALQEAMGAEVARNVSAFRVFRTRLRDAFPAYRGPYVSVDVLLTWGTTRFAHIPVQHDARKVGTSGYTVRKLIAHALNMATGFSTLPLQLASVVGFVFTVFGLLVLAYVVVNYISNGPNNVPGFAFVASMIAIFSGAQLFALGIIGEYLARMHFRAMDRPTYLIRERTDDEQHD